MHQIILRDPVLKDNLKCLLQYCYGEVLDFDELSYIFEGYKMFDILEAWNVLEIEKEHNYDS